MNAKVYFISDLHIGHKKIIQFSRDYRFGTTIEEHDGWLAALWAATVRARDVVYVLGDVTWTRDGLKLIQSLPGQKHLILGNHDTFPLEEYQAVFRVIRPGLYPYKGRWLSHAPIHPLELRGKTNVHGHVHSNHIPDKRYLNASVEAVGGIPRTLEELDIIQTERFADG